MASIYRRLNWYDWKDKDVNTYISDMEECFGFKFVRMEREAISEYSPATFTGTIDIDTGTAEGEISPACSTSSDGDYIIEFEIDPSLDVVKLEKLEQKYFDGYAWKKDLGFGFMRKVFVALTVGALGFNLTIMPLGFLIGLIIMLAAGYATTNTPAILGMSLAFVVFLVAAIFIGFRLLKFANMRVWGREYIYGDKIMKKACEDARKVVQE